MKPCRIFLGCLLLLLSLVSGGAWAQVVTEFSAGITGDAAPFGIAAGPDGNLWFTESITSRIGRITPAGVVTEFSEGMTSNAGPFGIALGPDGAMWFTEQTANKIGRIDPLTGTITEFGAGITPVAFPSGIAAGPDGSMWFTEEAGHRIGRITMAGAVTEFSAGLNVSARPFGITAALDGNLWFTENFLSTVGRITPAGVITEFSLTGDANTHHPQGITLGPDGNLWFTGDNAIVRMTTAGVQTEFSFGTIGHSPVDITSGPDGNLWYTAANRIGRITPAGVVTEFSAGISSLAGLRDIAAGPDGNLWFTENIGERIGRITTTGGPVLQGAASRKVHGGAGTFDMPLSLVTTNPSTEPRQGATATIVATFDAPILSADVTVTEGSAAAGVPTFSGHDVIVPLTGVTDQTYVTIALANVTSSVSGGGSATIRLGFLRGDVNHNRVVSVADVGLVNSQLAQAVSAANFLKDVNTSGTLTLADVAIVNANLTRALPVP